MVVVGGVEGSYSTPSSEEVREDAEESPVVPEGSGLRDCSLSPGVLTLNLLVVVATGGGLFLACLGTAFLTALGLGGGSAVGSVALVEVEVEVEVVRKGVFTTRVERMEEVRLETEEEASGEGGGEVAKGL